jgi:hypothetical protein
MTLYIFFLGAHSGVPSDSLISSVSSFETTIPSDASNQASNL